MIALLEIRRRPGRFAAMTATLGLLAFLLAVLTGLSDGLFYGSTGAVRNSTANAYVFSTSAETSLIRSQLPPQTTEQYREESTVAAASSLVVVLTPAEQSNGEVADVAVFGVGPGGVGFPSELSAGRMPNGPGEAIVDTRLANTSIGDQLRFGERTLTVVGQATEVSYQLQPTVWTDAASAIAIRSDVRPELARATFINAVALQVADGASLSSVPAVAGTSVASAEETALAIPGVEQQRSTLTAIIYTTVIVAAVVVTLFFILAVLEKRGLFAVLKAVGTPNRRLISGLVIQAVAVSLVACLIGIALAALMGSLLPPTIPLQLRAASLVGLVALIVVAACIGSALSARRVTRIDPAAALGGQE